MLIPLKKSGEQVLFIQIADAIMDYAKDKNLNAGDKLPSERALSEALKISRNSVRESLRFLETQGMISVHKGIGSFITSNYSERSVSLQFTQLNYRETLEIKTTLEILLASKLIPIITDEQLVHLDTLISDMDHEKACGLPFHETDLKFHEYLCNLSPSSTLKNMISDMIIILDNYWSQVGRYPENLFIKTIEYHRSIVDGLRNRDLAGVQQTYENMLQYDIELFVKHIENNKS